MPTTAMPTIAWFGYGNMGRAIARGAIASGSIEPADAIVFEPDVDAAAHARGDGIAAVAAALTDADRPNLRSISRVMLAVKPQSWPTVAAHWRAAALHSAESGVLAISVMAGVSSQAIAQAIGPRTRVVRAMPNTPAMVGAGMTAVAAGHDATAEDLRVAMSLFGSVGEVVELPETLLDAATALSGSGPAYFLLLCEAMADAAAQLGISPDVASRMARQTLLGTATMLAFRDNAPVSPTALRARVTSKGGTTHAAVTAFEAGGFHDLVQRALTAARDRGRELGSG